MTLKEITVTELVEMWQSRKKTEVIDILKNDHPGLTAVFLVQASQDGHLKRTDLNEIANLLIDARREVFLDTVGEFPSEPAYEPRNDA